MIILLVGLTAVGSVSASAPADLEPPDAVACRLGSSTGSCKGDVGTMSHSDGYGIYFHHVIAGTGGYVSVALLAGGRAEAPSEVDWEQSEASTSLQVVYRTTVSSSAGAHQTRDVEADYEKSVIGASAGFDDPLLKTWGVGAALEQEASGNSCTQRVSARANYLADEILISPAVPCVVALPFVEASELAHGILP